MAALSQVYRNLLELLDFDDIGMLYLEFVVTEDKLGVAETVELVEGGADITVDQVRAVPLHAHLVCGHP